MKNLGVDEIHLGKRGLLPPPLRDSRGEQSRGVARHLEAAERLVALKDLDT